jgi:hypothetical protein
MKLKTAPSAPKRYYEPPRPKHSYGRAVPRNAMVGCLCADKLTYSKKCCEGYLVNQGIGVTIGVPTTRAFSSGFSNGFS